MAAKNLVGLIHDARRELGLHSNTALASFLGVSRRTIQRHTQSGGIPYGDGHAQLIWALKAKNPDLSATLASAFNVDLNAAPAGRASAGQEHVALMLLTACDALNLPPRAVRPALAAIFRQARDLGVDLDQLSRLVAEGGGGQ